MEPGALQVGPETVKRASQVSVITGAGRGIGKEIALEHGREGAKVGLLARTARQIEEAVEAIGAAGGTARAYVVDVVDLNAVNTAFAAIEEDLGPIDVLVNNAGAFGGIGHIWDVDPSTWWRDVETNIRGTFNCCRAAVAGMMLRERGSLMLVHHRQIFGDTLDKAEQANCVTKIAGTDDAIR